MIIGFGYQARVGKDTAADYLAKYHAFSRRAFADSLKGACHIIFGLTDSQLHGNMKEVVDRFWGTTPRDILQRVGTECLRNGFDQEVWVKSLEHYLLRKGDKHTDWAISDLRFPNEAEAVRRMGGLVVRIDRDPSLRIPKLPPQTHASETAMDSYERWDYLIDNNGDFNNLYDQLKELVSTLP